MEALWSCGVEGDCVRSLVVEAERVLVSTGEQTLVVDEGRGRVSTRERRLVVSRAGDVLGRDERLLLRPPADERPSVLLGERRYALEEGALVTLDARGAEISRTRVAIDQFERCREECGRWLPEGTPGADEWVDRQIRGWWRVTALVADAERGRLLAVGASSPPWLARLRTDGGVEWALIVGRVSDCCNWAKVVANDGTLAHFSSCGRRVTFISTEGHIVSAHEVDGVPGDLFTNGRGVAYVTDIGAGRIAAYQPEIGRVRAFEIPHLERADLRDGILYTVIKHPSDGIVLTAFREAA